MKSNLILLGVAIFGLMGGFAFAGTGLVMHANIPYDFYLENHCLPAGEYTFEMNSGSASLIVRSKDGNGIRLLATHPDVDSNTAQLTFNLYGETPFLSSVSIQGRKATLKMVEAERELRTMMQKEWSTPTIALK